MFYTPLKIGANNNIGVKVVVEQYDRGNGQIHGLKTREAGMGVAVRPIGESTRGALLPTSSNDSIGVKSKEVKNSNEFQTKAPSTDRQDLDVQIEGTMNAKNSLTQSARVASTSAQAAIEDISKKSQNKRIDVLTDTVRRSGQTAKLCFRTGTKNSV